MRIVSTLIAMAGVASAPVRTVNPVVAERG
jgi:hypothetical protein